MKHGTARWLRRALGGILVALLGFGLLIVGQGWRAFGKGAEGSRLARVERSPHFKDGHFVNPEPLHNDLWGMLGGMFHSSEHVSPDAPPNVEQLSAKVLEEPPVSGLRVTWFGHSSILIEMDGRRVLTDPMWSERASPIEWLGPKRWYPPAVALADLPKLDAVLISHDHYDHLDYQSVLLLNERQVKFVVPLGVGAHLEYWGVPPERIVELDWWEQADISGLMLVCVPARHASGRFLFDKDKTLWAGYALVGEKHRVYYSGDTGLFPAMREIGDKLGPFDLTMIEVGQYNRSWPDWHIGPEQAVEAHQMVRGRVMLPVHWGLFGLAFHGWTEPAERTVVAADKRHAELLTPRPGQAIESTQARSTSHWWPQVPWETAEQSPIVSTQVQ